ncbi:flavin monoamine oxidase family protein [Fictibacillus enclensis]|uniref:flavin monoamine oxidase family protein n=1 Tax=Fictibacillus enclensis TaxID=1017270 RepID=UPI0024BFAB05|nr:flavin monoamine oxidase family protein [Fictibacillus enclensis]WHY72076.1 flavin monoamine oxidase family protein [Fictibacillus enclensis]
MAERRLLTEGEMLNTIRNGLPPAVKPKKIVIAGAGIAGLVAGTLLMDAGHDVKILEASQRVGGRIYSVRAPFTEGHHFEAGAMRIPDTHKLVFEYIHRFNLPYNRFVNRLPEDLFYANGRRARSAEYDQNPELLGFPVAPHERGKTAEDLMRYAIGPLVDYVNQNPSKNWPIVIQLYENYSVDAFLKNNPFGRSLSAGAVDKIKVLISLEGFPELSFLETFRDILLIFIRPNLRFYEITGGNDQLPNAFVPHLGNRLLFGKRLTRIRNHPKKVTLYTENPVGRATEEFEADRAIITIPFSVLNFVQIEPERSLSYSKRRAIRELHYVPSTKVGIQFKNRFWEREGLHGGKAVTDLASRFTYYPSHYPAGTQSGVVLGSYTWEDDSNLWSSLPSRTRVAETLRCLSVLHGPQVFDQYMTGTSFSWTSNPYAGGAFTMFKPYQEKEFGDVVSMPEGRLHFAGEHATMTHGWMQGSIESAIRAAHEVHESQ